MCMFHSDAAGAAPVAEVAEPEPAAAVPEVVRPRMSARLRGKPPSAALGAPPAEDVQPPADAPPPHQPAPAPPKPAPAPPKPATPPHVPATPPHMPATPPPMPATPPAALGGPVGPHPSTSSDSGSRYISL